jgi:Flp pilus assembly protein TadG
MSIAFTQTPPATGPLFGPTLRSTLRDRTRSEAGQALVEFTLILPVLVVLMFGIALFGLALNDWIDETHLASEAARYVAVNSEHGTGELKEASFLKWITEQGDNSQVKEAKATICSPTSAVGDWARVKLTYSYDWLKLNEMLGLGKAASTTFTSEATMRIEVPPKEKYKTTC